MKQAIAKLGTKTHTCCGKRLSNGVDANDGDTVAWYNSVTQVAVAVQLDVAWQFTIWHGFRRLLQFQQLVVYASAFLWYYEERINRALWTTSLITVTS